MRIATIGLLFVAGLAWSLSASPAAAPPPAPSAALLGAAVGNSVAGSTATAPPVASGLALAAPGRLVLSGRDAPDAFLYETAGVYDLFSSEGTLPNVNVPVVTSHIIGTWGPVKDALPVAPPWVLHGFTWAPDVHHFKTGYVLYFTSDVIGTTPPIECIGDATGTTPTGPFVPVDHPFICEHSEHGSIDPRTFTDTDGTTYMLWKSDENADVNGTSLTNIYSQPLSTTGLRRLTTPTRIFGPDEAWQGRIVEAPDMVEANGTYWMFYSGGWFNQTVYAVGTARCAGPLGPCVDTDPNPWFASNLQGFGPGEQSVFRTPSGDWMLYAPWRSDDPHPTVPRPIDMVRIGFGHTVPYVATPSPGTPPAAPIGANGAPLP